MARHVVQIGYHNERLHSLRLQPGGLFDALVRVDRPAAGKRYPLYVNGRKVDTGPVYPDTGYLTNVRKVLRALAIRHGDGIEELHGWIERPSTGTQWHFARISPSAPISTGIPPTHGAVPFVEVPLSDRHDREPFLVDPEKIERGSQAHENVRALLAAWLRERNVAPYSATEEPLYDLAWVEDQRTYIAEVKSLTVENESKQLRLGLGQLLWYRACLAQVETFAVLVVEREPSDSRWAQLCASVNVLIAWPGAFDRLAARREST